MQSIREHFSHRSDRVPIERRAWAADCADARANDPAAAGLRPVRVQSIGANFLTTWDAPLKPPPEPTASA